MPSVAGPISMAPAGTTGNNTHTIPVPAQFDQIAVEIAVEAAGATPTATFTVQGSANGADYVNLALLSPDASVATSNAALVLTVVGVTQRFIDGLDRRFLQNLRVAVSANTNVTYHVNAYGRNNE